MTESAARNNGPSFQDELTALYTQQRKEYDEKHGPVDKWPLYIKHSSIRDLLEVCEKHNQKDQHLYHSLWKEYIELAGRYHAKGTKGYNSDIGQQIKYTKHVIAVFEEHKNQGVYVAEYASLCKELQDLEQAQKQLDDEREQKKKAEQAARQQQADAYNDYVEKRAEIKGRYDSNDPRQMLGCLLELRDLARKHKSASEVYYTNEITQIGLKLEFGDIFKGLPKPLMDEIFVYAQQCGCGTPGFSKFCCAQEILRLVQSRYPFVAGELRRYLKALADESKKGTLAPAALTRGNKNSKPPEPYDQFKHFRVTAYDNLPKPGHAPNRYGKKHCLYFDPTLNTKSFKKGTTVLVGNKLATVVRDATENDGTLLVRTTGKPFEISAADVRS